MSVTVRLAKVGKRHAPAYKIVVANTRDKRNGRFLDVLGYYNPSLNPAEFKIDEKAYNDWKAKGALSTKAVDELVAGTYQFVPYNPNQKDEEEEGDNQEADSNGSEEKNDSSGEKESTEESTVENTSPEEDKEE